MNHQEIRSALRGVIDPELGINIIDLGLVYDIAIDGNTIAVEMTMTTPSCPLAEYMTDAVERTLALNFPHTRAAVGIVWEPAWGPEMITGEGRDALDGASCSRPAA
jgi:metal-sulfur cluster biosynthetic enzyme